MVLLLRELYISKDPEGVEHFPVEGPTFSRGVLMLVSIETHTACNFPGGGSGPLRPSGSEHACATRLRTVQT